MYNKIEDSPSTRAQSENKKIETGNPKNTTYVQDYIPDYGKLKYNLVTGEA